MTSDMKPTVLMLHILVMMFTPLMNQKYHLSGVIESQENWESVQNGTEIKCSSLQWVDKGLKQDTWKSMFPVPLIYVWQQLKVQSWY